jgi:DNA-binding PadR family transcriptional regulator
MENGKRDEAKTYFTNDKSDAEATAKLMRIEADKIMNAKPKITKNGTLEEAAALREFIEVSKKTEKALARHPELIASFEDNRFVAADLLNWIETGKITSFRF